MTQRRPVPRKRENLRILLTGVTGQVGGDLLPLLQSFAQVIAPTRAELDLTNIEAIRAFVRDARPHWIINPAAYTAVDKAESQPALAEAINASAPRILGEEAARLDAPVIHFSTDYVYDGTGDQPWIESDPTGPLGVYGKTKLLGEQALASTGAAHLILRTSWVYGARGKNFLLTLLRLAEERAELKVVADQFGAPTWSFDLANLVVSLISQMENLADSTGTARSQVIGEKKGIYNAASSGETSWFGFAREFLRLTTIAEPGRRLATLLPISTSEYPTAARRPQNSRLDCSRLSEVFGYALPAWQQSTSLVMAQLLAKGRRRSS